jgi:hypothetical protein
METNNPMRIAEPTITDARSDNSISHRPPCDGFLPALADYLSLSPGNFHCNKRRGKS